MTSDVADELAAEISSPNREGSYIVLKDSDGSNRGEVTAIVDVIPNEEGKAFDVSIKSPSDENGEGPESGMGFNRQGHPSDIHMTPTRDGWTRMYRLQDQGQSYGFERLSAESLNSRNAETTFMADYGNCAWEEDGKVNRTCTYRFTGHVGGEDQAEDVGDGTVQMEFLNVRFACRDCGREITLWFDDVIPYDIIDAGKYEDIKEFADFYNAEMFEADSKIKQDAMAAWLEAQKAKGKNTLATRFMKKQLKPDKKDAEITKNAVGVIVRDGDPSSPPSDIFRASGICVCGSSCNCDCGCAESGVCDCGPSCPCSCGCGVAAETFEAPIEGYWGQTVDSLIKDLEGFKRSYSGDMPVCIRDGIGWSGVGNYAIAFQEYITTENELLSGGDEYDADRVKIREALTNNSNDTVQALALFKDGHEPESVSEWGLYSESFEAADWKDDPAGSYKVVPKRFWKNIGFGVGLFVSSVLFLSTAGQTVSTWAKGIVQKYIPTGMLSNQFKAIFATTGLIGISYFGYRLIWANVSAGSVKADFGPLLSLETATLVA